MNYSYLSIVLFIVMSLPSFSHAEMYKWKDKNGQTQYTDTPPPSNIKLEGINGKKTSQPTGKKPLSEVIEPLGKTIAAPIAPVVSDKPSVSAEDEAARLRQQNAEADKANKQEKESQAKVKAENCKAAKSNLESYSQGGRMYKMNEKGEREYFDDAGLKQGADKARGEVSKYCS